MVNLCDLIPYRRVPDSDSLSIYCKITTVPLIHIESKVLVLLALEAVEAQRTLHLGLAAAQFIKVGRLFLPKFLDYP